MDDKCARDGHTWQYTTSVGWFRCARLLGFGAASKRTGKSSPVYCGCVAHCPGCLTYRMQGYVVTFCTVHQACYLGDFPVVRPGQCSPVQSINADQLSLFE